MTRAGRDAGGGAGPTSLSGELERDSAPGGMVGPTAREGEAEGGSAGPAILRRFSLASGLGARLSWSSRLRFEGCEGIAGPIEGIVGDCGGEVCEVGALTKARAQASGGPLLPISELRHHGRHSRIAASARAGSI